VNAKFDRFAIVLLESFVEIDISLAINANAIDFGVRPSRIGAQVNRCARLHVQVGHHAMINVTVQIDNRSRARLQSNFASDGLEMISFP
jgi:hypothetical protein